MVVPYVRRDCARGQAAIEFLVAFSFVLAFFVLMQLYSSQQSERLTHTHTLSQAEQLARRWATTIRTAMFFDGYSVELETPAFIDLSGTAYTLSVRNTSVSVSWQDAKGILHEVVRPLHDADVRNASGGTAFTLSAGVRYSINASKGVVWIV